jgi:hypothetical protein
MKKKEKEQKRKATSTGIEPLLARLVTDRLRAPRTLERAPADPMPKG